MLSWAELGGGHGWVSVAAKPHWDGIGEIQKYIYLFLFFGVPNKVLYLETPTRRKRGAQPKDPSQGAEGSVDSETCGSTGSISRNDATPRPHASEKRAFIQCKQSRKKKGQNSIG